MAVRLPAQQSPGTSNACSAVRHWTHGRSLTLAQVRAILRHSDLATTGRYLNARVEALFAPSSSTTAGRASRRPSHRAMTRRTSRRCSVVNRTTVEIYTARNRRIKPDENDRQEGPTLPGVGRP
jgi:hypothetical protein